MRTAHSAIITAAETLIPVQPVKEGHYPVREELRFMIQYKAALCGCPLWTIIIF